MIAFFTFFAPTAIESDDFLAPFRLAEILTFIPFWFMVVLFVSADALPQGVITPGLFFVLFFFMFIFRSVFLLIWGDTLVYVPNANTLYLAHRAMVISCWVCFVLLFFGIQYDLSLLPADKTDYIDLYNGIAVSTGLIYFIATLLVIPVAKKAHNTSEFITKQNSSNAAEFRTNVMSLINELDRYEGKSKNQLTYSKKQIKDAGRMK